MSTRTIRNIFAKWKYLIFACCVTYLFVFYIPIPKGRHWREGMIDIENTHEVGEVHEQEKAEYSGKPIFKFNPVGKEPFDVEEVLTYSPIKLAERMKANVKKGEKRLILSWNAGHSSANLQGCPDWNCEFTQDRTRAKDADAVLISYEDNEFKRVSSDQYVIYFSQESPVNSGIALSSPDFLNMTLGFRQDTPAGSPYGYTVKLGAKSVNKKGEIVDKALIMGKTKGAAWYVSHCKTNSRREDYIHRLQRYTNVDIYGGCGPLKCPRNGNCESMLDTDYHFYVAFENSLCKDYVTEKLWRQGYQKTIIPLVMKRSIVEPFVPPNSFIAADDFKSYKEMGDYLNYLMGNKTAYMEYFEWRRNYKVIFLDGANHDITEKPWGFCQVCRMVWTNPRERQVIENWDEYWKPSCEPDGQLMSSILEAPGQKY